MNQTCIYKSMGVYGSDFTLGNISTVLLKGKRYSFNKRVQFFLWQNDVFTVLHFTILFFFLVLEEKEVEFEAEVIIVLVMILVLKMAFVTSLHPKRLPVMSLQILKYHRAWQSYYLRGYKYFKRMREEINIMHLKTHL